ncbi:dockerin type 1 [Colletotrichum sojae]|uniref:Dockerin type 1 n=1 Tax=Colletotrichum sojae TaxID=2175907 RepID=A0A8H6MPT1_9PEZI|nr:dockerin type 1 [Colletotrichum sojae]
MTRSNQLLLALLATASAPAASAPAASAPAAAPVGNANEPAEFEPQPTAGPGGSTFKDSAHFRVYGAAEADATETLDILEGAYECFVNTLGWRTSGLSFNDETDAGPYYKTNVYSVKNLDSAAGVMHAEMQSGAAWLEVVDTWLKSPGVTVHEWGHGLHYHQKTWVDQSATGTWWETVANWVADTYQTSDLCAAAREKHGQPEGRTEFEVNKVLGDSFQVIVDGSVDTGNYYQAWPFLTYLTNNPDNFAGLGTDALHQMMKQYKEGSNETPLHTLERVLSNSSVGDVVGRYWARMAYVDIGHAQAQEIFLAQQDRINFANVDGSGSSYTVKSARAPRYMGANIIPLKAEGGKVDVKVTSTGSFTATLSIFDASTKKGRYVALPNGAGSATLAAGEEASLVVANTPKTLIQYNGFELANSEANKGMEYSFTLASATA